MLDATQIARYRNDGYVIVEGALDEDLMRRAITLAKQNPDLLAGAHATRDAEGKATLLDIYNELGSDPFSAIVASEQLVGVVEQLLGETAMHYHHKLMLKEPRVGGAWEWHQDYGYWYHRGCLYPRMLSCFVAMDPSTRANGCLQVLKGSHHLGRIDHGVAGEGQMGAAPDRVAAALERHEIVHVESGPGDALFFDCNLLHRSDANHSDQSRWTIVGAYTAASNRLFEPGEHPVTPIEVIPAAHLHDEVEARLQRWGQVR